MLAVGGTHPSKCPNCSEKACASDFSVRLLLHRRSIRLELPQDGGAGARLVALSVSLVLATLPLLVKLRRTSYLQMTNQPKHHQSKSLMQNLNLVSQQHMLQNDFDQSMSNNGIP